MPGPAPGIINGYRPHGPHRGTFRIGIRDIRRRHGNYPYGSHRLRLVSGIGGYVSAIIDGNPGNPPDLTRPVGLGGPDVAGGAKASVTGAGIFRSVGKTLTGGNRRPGGVERLSIGMGVPAVAMTMVAARRDAVVVVAEGSPVAVVAAPANGMVMVGLASRVRMRPVIY